MVLYRKRLMNSIVTTTETTTETIKKLLEIIKAHPNIQIQFLRKL